ncbi:MAG: CinA family nicotinamide mononucleotide deamidase-related protein [Oligoflexia bacterium]|nr:CinA family nicotinamide mononucleotide deamidase-related protein [Oligoflexia bacterium]
MNKKGLILISIGDELLDGRTQNTNASWIAEQSRESGVSVTEIRTVSDKETEIIQALKDAEKKATLVICTGGLGPTNDDRTIFAASKFLRKPLIQTKSSLLHIQKRYAARSLPLTEARLRLALIPKFSKVIDNPTGTAPGVLAKKAKCTFVFLPGPPNECRPMFTNALLPLLKKWSKKNALQERKIWRTFGLGESSVYQLVSSLVLPLEKKYPQTFRFGVHIHFPYIDLTCEIWNKEKRKKPSQKELQSFYSAVDLAVIEICFAKERISLAEAVSYLLHKYKLRIALAESCTGGLLGKMLTDLSGASAFLEGGIICYDNKVKEKILRVSSKTLEQYGAVSKQCVEEMAKNARELFSVDYALAVSGISGPTGATKEKPIGTTHVAIAGNARLNTVHQVLLSGSGTRDQNRILAAHLALNALRAEILSFHGNRFPLSSV